MAGDFLMRYAYNRGVGVEMPCLGGIDGADWQGPCAGRRVCVDGRSPCSRTGAVQQMIGSVAYASAGTCACRAQSLFHVCPQRDHTT